MLIGIAPEKGALKERDEGVSCVTTCVKAPNRGKNNSRAGSGSAFVKSKKHDKVQGESEGRRQERGGKPEPGHGWSQRP